MRVRILNYRATTPQYMVDQLNRDLARADVLVIGTHDGKFHADEVAGCALLLVFFESQYAYIVIVRTRVQDILDRCKYVLDVGGVYAPGRGRFDHHQPNFELTFKGATGIHLYNNEVNLAAAGCIYRYFGRAIIAQRLGLDLSTDAYNTDERVVLIFKKLYEHFIMEIDDKDSVGKSKIFNSGQDLNARVKALNPMRSGMVYHIPDRDVIPQFLKALYMVKEEFCAKLTYYASYQWWQARELTQRALKSRKRGEIIAFDVEDNVDFYWRDHLPDMEYELGCKGQVKFVIIGYLAEDREENQAKKAKELWVVKSVISDHQPRALLKINWRNKSGPALQHECGVRDAIWVGHDGKMGKAGSKSGALAMATKTLLALETGNEKKS